MLVLYVFIFIFIVFCFIKGHKFVTFMLPILPSTMLNTIDFTNYQCQSHRSKISRTLNPSPNNTPNPTLNNRGPASHFSPKNCVLTTFLSGTLYNKQRYHLYRVQHLQFMAACVPPGAGTSCGGVASYAISHRLSRLMTVLSFFSLSSNSLESIYSSVFLSWLEEFPAYSLTHHEHLAKVTTVGTS